MDWTYHHVSVSGPLSTENIDRARSEPRILFRLAERNLPRVGAIGRSGSAGTAAARHFRLRPKKNGMKIDWSIPLGTGIVAPNMFPAKYSFDINAAPNCANDYVVFGLNVAGATPGQANLVGVNNLYSGSTPRLCAREPHRELGLQREHGRRFSADFPGSFTGWQENRLCGERRWNRCLPRADLEGRRRNVSHRRRDPDAQRRLHRYRCCAHEFVPQVRYLLDHGYRHALFSLGGLSDRQGFRGHRRRQDLPDQLRLQLRPQYQSYRWTGPSPCPWPALAARRRDPMVRSTTSPAAASLWAINSENFGSSMPVEPARASTPAR